MIVRLSTGHVFVRDSVVAITPISDPRYDKSYSSMLVSFDVVGVGFAVPVNVAIRRTSDDPQDDFLGPIEPYEAYLKRVSGYGEAVRQEFIANLLQRP